MQKVQYSFIVKKNSILFENILKLTLPGLSGSGKSTIAVEVEKKLAQQGGLIVKFSVPSLSLSFIIIIIILLLLFLLELNFSVSIL